MLEIWCGRTAGEHLHFEGVVGSGGVYRRRRVRAEHSTRARLC